jgi:hypothetical protein
VVLYSLRSTVRSNSGLYSGAPPKPYNGQFSCPIRPCLPLMYFHPPRTLGMRGDLVNPSISPNPLISSIFQFPMFTLNFGDGRGGVETLDPSSPLYWMRWLRSSPTREVRVECLNTRDVFGLAMDFPGWAGNVLEKTREVNRLSGVFQDCGVDRENPLRSLTKPDK